MSILVVRHGLSEANNRENFGTPAFGNPKAPLMELGEEQAALLGDVLMQDYGVDVAKTTVATSMLRRTQETAIVAGFRHLSLYPLLNEVDHGLGYEDLRTALHTAQPPLSALEAADAVLESTPMEDIWVTHALLIAGLCRRLDVYQEDRFIPKFCEVRELPL